MRRSKKTSNLRVSGLYAGNIPVTGEFPAQRASNAENVSIWWRHHDPLIQRVNISLISSRYDTFQWYEISFKAVSSGDFSYNSSPLGQNGHHFAYDIFRCIFVTEKFCILTQISLWFVPNGPIDNNPALVQIMAWWRIGDKPLSEPMLTRFTDAYMRH